VPDLDRHISVWVDLDMWVDLDRHISAKIDDLSVFSLRCESRTVLPMPRARKHLVCLADTPWSAPRALDHGYVRFSST